MRQAACDRERIQHARHRETFKRPRGHDGYRFGGGIVDNRQTLQHAAFGAPIEDEIGRPHLVRRDRSPAAADRRGAGTITPGGSAVTLSTTTPGQNGKLTFSGTAGHRISLKGTSGLSGQVLGCDVNISILNPDGTQLAAPTCMEGSGFIDVKPLATTGTYSIKMDPVDIAAGSLTLTLYDVPADPTPTIVAGGSAVTVTLSTPGQNAALTFSGTTDQRIFLKGTNAMTAQILGCDVNVTILNPNSSTLAPARQRDCFTNKARRGHLTLDS